MKYIDDLKTATLAELEEAAAEWRGTVEGYHLEEVEDACLGAIEFSQWGTDDVTADAVEADAERNIQILTDAMLDIQEWAKVETLRIKARAKAKVPA